MNHHFLTKIGFVFIITLFVLGTALTTTIASDNSTLSRIVFYVA